MSGIGKFGEEVEGIRIPVLNEREIRAAAGILFVLLKYAIAIFLPDMLIRVFVGPRYSPTLILGRLIVRNQAPEYVGAPQNLRPDLRDHLPRVPGVPLLRDLLRHLHRLQGLPARRPGEGGVLPRRGLRAEGPAGDPADSPAQLLIVLGLAGYVVLVAVLLHAGFGVRPRALFGG